ncbi:hypothetical protein BJ165DRAFT_1527344 [Panaeolus papilionaceus]|nr:hypothetical protein BJ165DRAFT_1527344 [Panaeolus papilionaceus]
MPRDLPGFYYDAERNRYFPESAKPKISAAQTSNQHLIRTRRTRAVDQPTLQSEHPEDSEDDQGLHCKRRKQFLWTFNENRRAALIPNHGFSNLRHEIRQYHYSLTSHCERVKIPTIGAMTAFTSTFSSGRAWRFLGDNQGILYTEKNSEIYNPDSSLNYHWSAEMVLQQGAAISSISSSGNRIVATCLGHAKVAVQELDATQRTFVLNMSEIYDVRASCLDGPSLALGASKKAVYISDIDASNGIQCFHTKSDVFSLAKQRVSSRNGRIDRWDLRLATRNGQTLFDGRFGLKPRRTVVHLQVLREFELLTNQLDGQLATYDLRYLKSQNPDPLVEFSGHQNAFLSNLVGGLAVDPHEEFLFAAGHDNRIRGWSLLTGEPLSTDSNPAFDTESVHPICALEVTEEPGLAGLTLWAAVDRDLYQFHLGQVDF